VTTDLTTSACQFVGGPYDGRTIAVHDHVNTVDTGILDVDPDLRWIPELGGWVSISNAEVDLTADPGVTARTIRYERHPGGRFELAEQPS
jgi:hypothetical protein